MTRPTTSERRPPWRERLRRAAPPAVAGFLGVELACLAAAHAWGGPPWTLLTMIAFLAQIAVDFRVAPLAMLAPGLAWLALHHVTGDRELFFPFAMTVAIHVALLASARGTARALLGGGGVVAVFLAIRGLQAASPRVLAVEAGIAVAILVAAVAAHAAARTRPAAAAIVALSSLAAYAALAL